MAGKRIIYIIIGIVASVIAIIGVWLPGVPTVFPLLIALWAFSRSSEWLHRKLIRLPLLKSALSEARAYEQHRSVTKRTKIIAQASAWTSVAVLAVTTRNIWIVIAVAVIAAACSLFMFLTPTCSTDVSEESV